jgi:acyl-CoA synthetase (AMP-forming)/AMP-acid ligase II
MTETNPIGTVGYTMQKAVDVDKTEVERFENIKKAGLPLPGLELKLVDGEDFSKELPHDGEAQVPRDARRSISVRHSDGVLKGRGAGRAAHPRALDHGLLLQAKREGARGQVLRGLARDGGHRLHRHGGLPHHPRPLQGARRP